MSMIQGPSSGHFLDPILSQWGKNQVAHFSQLFVIANSTMDDINPDHPGLPRGKFCYVTAVRSCDVIKCDQKVVLLIASNRNEQQLRAWSRCVQLIKTDRMICMLTLKSC